MRRLCCQCKVVGLQLLVRSVEKKRKNAKITRGQKGFKKHQIANELWEGLNSLAG